MPKRRLDQAGILSLVLLLLPLRVRTLRNYHVCKSKIQHFLQNDLLAHLVNTQRRRKRQTRDFWPEQFFMI